MKLMIGRLSYSVLFRSYSQGNPFPKRGKKITTMLHPSCAGGELNRVDTTGPKLTANLSVPLSSPPLIWWASDAGTIYHKYIIPGFGFGVSIPTSDLSKAWLPYLLYFLWSMDVHHDMYAKVVVVNGTVCSCNGRFHIEGTYTKLCVDIR